MRFVWKLYAGFAVLILMTTTIVGVRVAREVSTDMARELRHDLEVTSAVAATCLSGRRLGEEGRTAPELARTLGSHGNLELSLHGPDGRAYWTTTESTSERLPVPPEAVRDEARTKGLAVRMARNGTPVHCAWRPLALEDGNTHYLRVAMPSVAWQVRLDKLRAVVATSAGIALAFGLLLGLFLTRQLTFPLSSISDAARDLAAGDLERRVGDHGRDELGELAISLDALAANTRRRLALLEEERTKLNTIFLSLVEGVIAVDERERIMHINPAAESLLGLEEAKVQGAFLRDVTRIYQIADLLQASIRSGQREQGEMKLRAGVADRIFELRSAPIRLENREIVGAVVGLHEVTEVRRLEAVRRDFVTNVGHELKTPITVIRGMTDTLIDDPEMPAEMRHQFQERIGQQCERLHELVRDLLVLERLEGGAGHEDFHPVDLRASLAAAIHFAQPLAEKKDILILTDLCTEAAMVQASEDALRVVIDNLLSNAIRYSHDDSEVRAAVRLDETHCVLEVTDRGIGIEPLHIDRIFERFYRADRARSRDRGGTGLGLSIVKHQVQQLAGTIEVESELGVGSTFRVRFARLKPRAVRKPRG